jgi:hypothetical protein
MHESEHRQLPVRVDLAPRESGLGFALRALRANGIAFDRGMRWLGLERHRPLDRQAGRRIAWALNVDADLWSERVVIRDADAQGWIRLAGQRFKRQVATNKLYAKLCPQCVRELGIVSLSWLLRAAVGCPRHGYSLIWRCHRCGRSIGWDRPDVDICRCGYPFKASSEAQPVEDSVRAWLQWLDLTLSPGVQKGPISGAYRGLPVVLTHLSVDGAFRMIEAMGLCADADSSVRTEMSNCATPAGLGSAVARGLYRLSLIEADPECANRFAGVVHQGALTDIATDCASEADRALASWLLSALRGSVDSGGTRAGSRPKGQLPLFVT